MIFYEFNDAVSTVQIIQRHYVRMATNY